MLDKIAGKEWLRRLMNRNKKISIRSPQPTSLTRATVFSKHTVETFLSKLGGILDKHKFEASDIYNFDETGRLHCQR